MAKALLTLSPLFAGAAAINHPEAAHRGMRLFQKHAAGSSALIRRPASVFQIEAAKIPSGVEMPKEEPELKAAFGGFTTTAEIWNSRAAMIGILGIFILELILKKGVLEIIGVEVGKGLDIPL